MAAGGAGIVQGGMSGATGVADAAGGDGGSFINQQRVSAASGSVASGGGQSLLESQTGQSADAAKQQAAGLVQK